MGHENWPHECGHYSQSTVRLHGRVVFPIIRRFTQREGHPPPTMLEGIQRGLSDALKKLRGRGRLTEANIRDGLHEVRRALLDADVNFTVADEFIKRVTEKSVGQEVLRTLDPSEQIVKIVYDE